MFRKALEIDEKVGRLEGMANAYGNLGIVMRTRGDLDGAEGMFRTSLEIEEKLGRLDGMASDYGNLGAVMAQRGDLAAAREMWERSRDLFARLGAAHKVEQVQGWIDALPGG
jgi:tetratricopeptide (TPR) repeat protein